VNNSLLCLLILQIIFTCPNETTMEEGDNTGDGNGNESQLSSYTISISHPDPRQ
jgi:hypothetical protein